MKSEDFVEKLKLIAPSKKMLVELDYDIEFIEIYLKSFLSKKGLMNLLLIIPY